MSKSIKEIILDSNKHNITAVCHQISNIIQSVGKVYSTNQMEEDLVEIEQKIKELKTLINERKKTKSISAQDIYNAIYGKED